MFVSIEATKNIMLFWVMLANTLGVSVGGFFTFDLFDLLILILGVHCCIVLVVLEDILFKIVTVMTKIVINSFVTMIPIM